MIKVKSNKCSIHQDFKIQFANISNLSTTTPFLCQICLLKIQFQDTFVSISEIIKSNDNAPIQNWPLGICQNSIDFLNDQSIQNKKQPFKDKINLFYKELQSQILQVIETSQIEQLQILDEQFFEKNEIMNLYNEIFQRQELKSIFTNQNEFTEQNYQLFLNKIESTRNQNVDLLQSKIQNNKNIENCISYGQSSQIQLLVSNLLSKINFFSQDILSNHNNISDKIVSEIQLDLQDSQPVQFTDQIINGLNQFNELSKIIQQNMKNIKELSRQNKSNIDDITKLIIKQNNEMNNNIIQQINDYIFNIKQEIYFSSQQEQAISTDVKKIISQYKSLDTQQINILQKYEKNEKSSKNYFLDLISFLEQKKRYNNLKPITLNLIKSNWQESQELTLQRQWFISNEEYNMCGKIYSKQGLKVNKTYIVRFKFNHPFYQCNQVWIGISCQDVNESSVVDQYLGHIALGQYQTVLKGKFFKLAENKDEIFEIEMRVRLDEGIVQFSDYPFYNNVLQNKEKIDLSQQYRLGICLQQSLNKEITITHYEKLSDWEPFES